MVGGVRQLTLPHIGPQERLFFCGLTSDCRAAYASPANVVKALPTQLAGTQVGAPRELSKIVKPPGFPVLPSIIIWLESE